MVAASVLFRDQALAGICPAVLAGVARDSRTVAVGQAYVWQSDDSRHAGEARTRGAAVVVGAGAGADLRTASPRWSFARASAALHGCDRRALPLLATTGTKGKSTVTHFTWWMLGAGAARIGTIGWHDGTNERPNRQTTPPPEELHGFLAGLPATCPGLALEASSHAGDQHRLAGLHFAALAFTGFGHDHLDYHGTQAGYVQAKLRLIRLVRPGGLVVVNADDPRAGLIAQAARHAGARIELLGADRLVQGPAGWSWDGAALPLGLPGAFNAWNAAAAVLLVEMAGVDRATALARLASCPPPAGRMELLAQAPATYVDFAHTPESIALAIAALRAAHPGAPLAIVFGCGGDRDASKRAPMGRAAATADVVVITTDNSRSEDPALIAAAIVSGLGATAHVVIAERAAAIRHARSAVGPAGVVLVAGKGHETTQDIGGTVVPWSDRDFVRGLGRP
jgi:UDP-N-acetylmuramoyl-L-alanyl-D-glutamate--2,6-diaminopimelate ligase